MPNCTNYAFSHNNADLLKHWAFIFNKKMRFEPKIAQKLTLGSMAFSDGWQNYWQSEPSYRPHSENMICANSEREKRDISCRAWENEMCTLKITE